MARKILLYSHDTFGFGNIRRNHALARRIVDTLPRTKVLLLTSSRWFHLFPEHPRIEFVKMPELLRVGRGRYESRTNGVKLDPLLRVRREIVAGAARGFRPDLVLVDKIPRGIGNELDVGLERLRKRGVPVTLVLRDVLDDPIWTKWAWNASSQYEALERYYRSVWVIGDEAVYPTASLYGLTRIPGLDIRYCGYISPETEPCSDGNASGTKRTLVTVGGGEDGREVIEWVVEALAGSTRAKPTDIVLGPFFPTSARQKLADRIRMTPHVRCLDYVPDMPRRMRSAGAVVSMGGYNSVCEILASHTPALIVPRAKPSAEQTIRARRMAKLGFFKAVAPDEGRDGILSSIRSFLENPIQDSFPRPDRGGLCRAAEFAEAALA